MQTPHAREFFAACPRSHKTTEYIRRDGEIYSDRRVTPAAAALLDEVEGELDTYLRRKARPQADTWDVMDDLLADFDAEVEEKHQHLELEDK
jgi:hypothetical protein